MFDYLYLDNPPTSPIVNTIKKEANTQNETIYRTMYVFFLYSVFNNLKIELRHLSETLTTEFQLFLFF